MRAGLERHIERRAARRFARLVDRDPLGVRPSARRGRSAPDDRAVLHQDRADSGIGRRKAERPRSQIERRLHPAQILMRVCGCAFAHVAGAFRRWRGASFAGRGLRLRLEFADDGVEVARLAEIAVDRGETHVGDVVEGLQALHHQFADPLGRDVAVGLALELAHDAVDHALDPLGLDRCACAARPGPSA